jgi:hypothetical protein
MSRVLDPTADRELPPDEARAAFENLFRGFDARIAKQRIFDGLHPQHNPQSASAAVRPATETFGENSSESAERS